jgi:hypothetical protein
VLPPKELGVGDSSDILEIALSSDFLAAAGIKRLTDDMIGPQHWIHIFEPVFRARTPRYTCG